MPEDAANSFTDTQLAIIERALDCGRRQIHPVNLRLSIPLLWRRFYLVLLAGPEPRSAERRRSERINRHLRAIANSVVFAVFLVLLIPATVGSAHLIFLDPAGL
jgi:hypothetical protein